MNKPHDAWRDILAVAISAPSPHNVQPWKIKIINQTEARVYIAKDRMLPREDTTGSFILSGMMMFVELMAIVAQNHGFQLAYSLLERDESGPLIPFADLRLTAGSEPSDYPDELILKRRTSRLPYEHRAVPEDAHQALAALADKFGQHYSYVSDASKIESILDVNITALFDDLNSPGYHDEITHWFRFSRRQSQAHADGLDYRCMNMSPTDYWLSARMPFLLKVPLLSLLMRRRYRSILGHVPVFGYVSGPFWEPEEALTAGRFLMHFWLELTKLGLYLHPFGNLVTNRAARSWLERELDAKDLWFVFRVGYSPEPPQSHRRKLSDALVEGA
jgi:nitroreductase